ncbi:MAG: RsmD family RNA methyltransferase [Planctomycetota bacterium]|jgi:16S rRNA (guanine(966)-N(2))-methyltransferase RsmD
MRIIAGTWRGRKLEVPPGIRPMLDRERERLFGVLRDRIPEAAFLDLFAGSGAIGLEALSRGARLATLVENGRKVLPVLRRNIEALDATDALRLLPISAFSLNRSGEPGPGTVDIAVCAPPFPILEDPALRPRMRTLLDYVARRLVRPGGVFALEHPGRLDPGELSTLGPPLDTRRTAASALSFWEPGAAPEVGF